MTAIRMVDETDVSISIKPEKITGAIDEKIYGHFLEHIYRACNHGLWGEMVWNRSFEEDLPCIKRVDDSIYIEENAHSFIALYFGDKTWTDYEITLEAKKLEGRRGLYFGFRAKDSHNLYMYFPDQYCKRNSLWQYKPSFTIGGTGGGSDGTWELNKWYKVRIRCESNHIQGWLDQKMIIDYKDKKNPELDGNLFLGACQAKGFVRNIKITSLDGNMLFEGLPETPDIKGIARFWKYYGDAKILRVKDAPLNSYHCVLIESTGGESGLYNSKPINAKTTDPIKGSLWLKGKFDGQIELRLLDGKNLVGYATVKSNSGNWQEHPVEIIPSVNAKNAQLQIAFLGSGKLYIDQVSLMAKSSLNAGGYRPDLLEAVNNLQPPVIRWPGGSFACRYMWKYGIGPQHKRVVHPFEQFDDIEINAFGTDEFIEMSRKVGAEPVIVINTGAGDKKLREQRKVMARDWIDYCNGPATSKWGKVRADFGHHEPYNVKYWEIDNELWGLKAEEYSNIVKDFVPVLKGVDPSIKIAVVGSGGISLTDRRGLAWNKVIIEECAELIDYISVHHYESENNFAQGPYNFERFFEETYKFIAKSKNPDVKIYVSEWNVFGTNMRSGLYAGGLLNAFERCGNFLEMGGPALFLRHTYTNEWDNAFVNFDHRKWFGAPNYVVMKLWREHYAPTRIAIDGKTEPLNVVATKSENNTILYFKTVNPTENAVNVELRINNNDFVLSEARLKLIAAGSLDAHNTLDEPDVIKSKPYKVEQIGNTITFTMPSYSAGVVTMSKKR